MPGRSVLENQRAALAYALLFGIWFIRYPILNSLPADIDSWFYVGAFRYYFEYLQALIAGTDIGISYYPHPYPYLNGEPGFGIFPIWMLFRLTGLNDLWTYSLCIAAIFWLNAWAFFQLGHVLFPKSGSVSRFTAGFFFAFNSFTLANLDNPNTVCLGPALLAIRAYVQWIEHNTIRRLYAFLILSLWQLLASAYSFLYEGLFIITYSITYLPLFIRRIRSSPVISLSTGFLLFAGTTSYLALQFILSDKSAAYNYSNNAQAVQFISFHPLDFVRTLPGSLWYHSEIFYFWILQYKSLFSGFIFTALTSYALFRSYFQRPELLLTSFFAAVIGSGIYTEWNGQRIMLPLGWLFETFDLYSFYRAPFRIWFLIQACAILASIPVLEFAFRQCEHKKWPFILLSVLMIAEFTPIPPPTWPSSKVFADADSLQKSYRNQSQGVFLFLPCGELVNGQSPLINRADYIYMYFQACIHKNVVNGYDSFFPPERMELNEALRAWQENPLLLRTYLIKYKVNQIIWFGPSHGFAPMEMPFEHVVKLCRELNIKLEVRN